MKLQEVTKSQVLSFKEAVRALNWKLTQTDNTYYCECNCNNSQIAYLGFFGTEVVECENCGKSITDLFSPIRIANATCAMLNPKDFEIEKDAEGNDRYWIISTADSEDPKAKI